MRCPVHTIDGYFQGVIHMNIGSAITLIQVFFGIVIGIYFLNLLRSQQSNRLLLKRVAQRAREAKTYARNLFNRALI